MMTFDGQTVADLEARSLEREIDHPAVVATLALVVGVLIGLIAADALYEIERPTAAEALTGRSAVVAAPAVEGSRPLKLLEPAP